MINVVDAISYVEDGLHKEMPFLECNTTLPYLKDKSDSVIDLLFQIDHLNCD